MSIQSTEANPSFVVSQVIPDLVDYAAGLFTIILIYQAPLGMTFEIAFQENVTTVEGTGAPETFAWETTVDTIATASGNGLLIVAQNQSQIGEIIVAVDQVWSHGGEMKNCGFVPQSLVEARRQMATHFQTITSQQFHGRSQDRLAEGVSWEMAAKPSVRALSGRKTFYKTENTAADVYTDTLTVTATKTDENGGHLLLSGGAGGWFDVTTTNASGIDIGDTYQGEADETLAIVEVVI